ncbi:hypothetical protein INT44_002804 [Umbelopsis vinacea]|uniref:Uncharacterized protein n=1 Tax=Umbelopsis vinacea TaxID=44442 RepID=A0A8H7Q6R7_9FUNG|nr:hypothetical protein INT44_002804 [Umbelopsis vinacea]
MTSAVHVPSVSNSSASTADSSSCSSPYGDGPLVPPDLLESLIKHSLFQRTNNQSFIYQVANKMSMRIFQPKDVIIKQGDPSKALFFLLRGTVQVCSRDAECIFAELQQGSFFGEIGILFSIPRTATIIADTKCIVACLTAETLQKILPKYPEVEKVIRFEAEERLAILTKKRQQYLSPHGETGRRRSEEMADKDSFVKASVYGNICKLQIFSDCDNQDLLHTIALSVDSKQFLPNTTIIHRGEASFETYFIISGTVEIIAPVCLDTYCLDTSDAVICRLGPGSQFGEVAALLDIQRAADVRAITPVDCYVLTRSKLRRVLHQYPWFAAKMKEMAEDRLAKLRHIQQTYDFSAVIPSEGSTDLATSHANSITGDESQQVPQGPLHGGVDTSTICSTSSDSDPTLSSAVSKIREMGTRKRRASVAVWSDPNLLAFAEQKAAEQMQEAAYIPSRFEEPVMMETDMETAEATPSNKPPCLVDIKEDLLINILEYVDFATVMKFRGVCKRMDKVLKSRKARTLFTEVDLSHWNKKMVDDVFIPISTFLGNRVREMNLSNCFHLTFRSFKTIANNNTKIARLDLHSCWELVDSSLALLAGGCPYLTDIDLSNCRKITDRGIYALFSTPRQCYPDTADASPYMIVDNQSIPSTPSTPSTPASGGISHISLSYCKNLTDISMRHIAEFGADTLAYINFQRCTSITDAGFEAWQPDSFKCLETVILNDCTFLTDRAIASLARAAPNIRYISLSFCCSLTDNAIEMLARQLRYLEHLDASFCGSAVSDASVQALVQEGSPNLKEINVRGCVRVTDTAVYALLAIARQLHLLNISQCQSVTIKTKDMLEHYKEKENCAQVVV